MAIEFPEAELEGEVFGDKPRPRKKGAAYTAITLKTAEERLKRLKKQNEKLALELKKAKGDSVSFEKHKREVLAANAVVKQQLLAVPFRLATQLAAIDDPREVSRVLTAALTECLNDLAYERDQEKEV